MNDVVERRRFFTLFVNYTNIFCKISAIQSERKKHGVWEGASNKRGIKVQKGGKRLEKKLKRELFWNLGLVMW